MMSAAAGEPGLGPADPQNGAGGAPRRGYAVALVALAGGGSLALVAAQAAWVSAAGAEVAYRTSFTGSQLAPALVACALVAMSGAVAVIATRGLGRRIVGAVLTVVGLGIVLEAAGVLADPAGAARHLLALVSGGAASLPRSVSVAWWWCALAGLGGAAVITGAVLTILRGGRWPVMAARYDAPTARPRSGNPTAGDAWSRLDRGEDPTVDDGAEPAADPAVALDPDPAADRAPDPARDPLTSGQPDDLQQ